MGLTGAILSARFRLVGTATAYYDVTYRRTANVDETLEIIAQTDAQYRYSVAWIDCLARGKSLGRSVLMLGNDAEVAALPAALRSRPLTVRAEMHARRCPASSRLSRSTRGRSKPSMPCTTPPMQAAGSSSITTRSSILWTASCIGIGCMDGGDSCSIRHCFPRKLRAAPDRSAGTCRRFREGFVPGGAQEQRAGRFGNALVPARRPHPGVGFPLHGSGSAGTASRAGTNCS